MPQKILITNDDGVGSSGLLAAYEAVCDLGETYVVAPATQQSAVGRSMTLFEPLRIARQAFGDTMAYSVNGTPTDSVIIGMFVVLDRKPDLVISGINIGENLRAEAATTSGTIGAALEASNQGIPAIAVSMRVMDEGDKFVDTNHIRDYAVVQRVIRRLAERILAEGCRPGWTCSTSTSLPTRRRRRRLLPRALPAGCTTPGCTTAWIRGEGRITGSTARWSRTHRRVLTCTS